MASTRPRILVICQGLKSFVERDIEILDEEFDARVFCDYPPSGARLGELWREVRRADLLLIWFMGRHALLPLLLGRLLGRRVVLVAGGWDVAACPEIGYGLLRSGWRRLLLRPLFRLPQRVVSVSAANQLEAWLQADVRRERSTLILHGFPPPPGVNGAGAGSVAKAEPPIAVTVGEVKAGNLQRKGLLRFLEVARLVPEVRFQMIGGGGDGTLEELRRIAPANLEVTGFLPDDELRRRLRAASVYLQLSVHEAFGCAVAEAMQFGCVPVVADRAALPEVVGEAGYVVPLEDLEGAAAAVRAASVDRRRRWLAAARVAEAFPLSRRRDALLALVRRELAAAGRAASAR